MSSRLMFKCKCKFKCSVQVDAREEKEVVDIYCTNSRIWLVSCSVGQFHVHKNHESFMTIFSSIILKKIFLRIRVCMNKLFETGECNCDCKLFNL